jgi:predicted branched-subunit amino acid permease
MPFFPEKQIPIFKSNFILEKMHQNWTLIFSLVVTCFVANSRHFFVGNILSQIPFFI